MIKKMSLLLVTLLVASMMFSTIALAATNIDAIDNATTPDELEAAIINTAELSDQAAKMQTMTWSEKNNMLTNMLPRLKYLEDIEGFKALFEREYTDATTYMSYATGYPYITDVTGNGATLVVKTDISGFVYVICMNDDIQGGLNGAQHFIEYYKADNGLYKKKVYVEGGKVSEIALGGVMNGRGVAQRVYTLLETNSCYSGFAQLKYTTLLGYAIGWKEVFSIDEMDIVVLFLYISSPGEEKDTLRLFLNGIEIDSMIYPYWRYPDSDIGVVTSIGVYPQGPAPTNPYMTYTLDFKFDNGLTDSVVYVIDDMLGISPDNPE